MLKVVPAAKPPNVQRSRVVVVMRLDAHLAALLAWLTMQFAIAYGVAHRGV